MTTDRDDDAPVPPAHTLNDHRLGADVWHEHGEDADHDHDDFEVSGPIEENPIWIQDNITLRSAGIDIGSAGTQVVFSRIHLRRHGEDLSSRYLVVARETDFLSPVRLTPYSPDDLIDNEELGAIIDEAYGLARLTPDDVDTGVVILTGEALRRENAARIAEVLAEKGGDFVSASAGHHMEAVLAAYGSGAARVSQELDKRILNVDIGGGTTKLAIVENGRVLLTAAIHIGGRLLAVDDAGRIARLDPAGAHHARRAGFEWLAGRRVRSAELDGVADCMADALMGALTGNPPPDDVLALYLTDPITDFTGVAGVMFSGGVAEYVYGRENRNFGDLGQRLGRTIARALEAGELPWPLLPAGECIRATALGASEYSVQISGNTGYISDYAKLLPRRNLQVVQPDFTFADDFAAEELARAIRRQLAAFDLTGAETDVALAFQWRGTPDYPRVRAFAEGLREGLAERIALRRPIYAVLDEDIAMTLGSILREDLGVDSEIMVIDGLTLWDFDYIDLGKIRLPSFTVPVTIKSLVFTEDPRGPRPRERLHHRPGGQFRPPGAYDPGAQHGPGNGQRAHGRGQDSRHDRPDDNVRDTEGPRTGSPQKQSQESEEPGREPPRR